VIIKMSSMRTTLTLEPDVARRLEQEVRGKGRGLKEVVNEALRRGFGLPTAEEPPPPFEVRPHSYGFKPGVDLDRVNQLLDELEAHEAARKLRA
jgi:hypothetical protein